MEPQDSGPPTLDARQLRTRRALEAAVLRLATDGPVSDLSMSQLAREAGLHRTTLYQHLRSPAAFLAEVLQAELDAVRDAHLAAPPDGDLGAATRSVVLAVLDHLEAHAPIYRRELASGPGPLSAMLADHFAASARTLIETHGLGPDDPGVPRALFVDLAARWIGDAVVGAMTAWLLRDPPRDRDAYLRVHAALLPAWWPRLHAPGAG